MIEGFTFSGQHSSEFGIQISKITHVLKPEKRMFQTVIAGRDGTYDTSDGTYSNIVISIDCDYIGEDIRTTARSLASWLSTSGELILDEEPDKIYQANIYSQIPIEELLVLNEFTLPFECFPFAMSLPIQKDAAITAKGQEISLSVDGTAKTPCTIAIKNTGTTNITNLRLTHRKEV